MHRTCPLVTQSGHTPFNRFTPHATMPRHLGGRMRRREFITLLASAAAWPFMAGAQQPDGMRRVAILMNRAADDAEGEARLAAFKGAMEQLGWSDGRNMQIAIRWGK